MSAYRFRDRTIADDDLLPRGRIIICLSDGCAGFCDHRRLRLTDVAHACGLGGATLGGPRVFRNSGIVWEDDAPRVFIAAFVDAVDVIVTEVVALASRGNAQRRRRAAGPVRFCECSRTAARRG